MRQDPKIFRHLMAILTKTGMQGRRHAICWDFSKERTESSKELTNTEMLSIIEALEKGFSELDRCDVMRKKIISRAHEMGWQKPPVCFDSGKRGKPIIDMNRVNYWCEKYGMFHKKLNAHNYKELVSLVSQFENFYETFQSKL